MISNIVASLNQLRLRYLAVHYDEFIKTATKQRSSPTEIVESLIKLEIEERRLRSTEARLQVS